MYPVFCWAYCSLRLSIKCQTSETLFQPFSHLQALLLGLFSKIIMLIAIYLKTFQSHFDQIGKSFFFLVFSKT